MEPASKYRPYPAVPLPDRRWPEQRITAAPIWCSVDLRDGNQALTTPMTVAEKLEFFKTLCAMGFREIEVGFPAASETEFEICRALIEGDLIPDGVSIQVLTQEREHLIRRTFEAIRGAKDVILHIYSATSEIQRRVVYGKDIDGVTELAAAGAALVRQLGDGIAATTRIRYEYSPEGFSATEPEAALQVCTAVMRALKATPEQPVILNLPNTVEHGTPNRYADQVEYFIRHLPDRDAAIISIHPHNDRGTGVAAAELALMAGAERVEGTLFGNGERTGNLDLVTLGLNLYTQGVEPGLDFSDLPALRGMYERCTGMRVPERQPYAGDLVFTAFSGSHQDAINKGTQYRLDHKLDYWSVPYLPIDPADVGRQYEPIIRINSQSGKAGAAFVMAERFGYLLPKAMHPEFGALVKAACDGAGRELTPDEVFAVFDRHYLQVPRRYALQSHSFFEEAHGGVSDVHFKGRLTVDGVEHQVHGIGNGPLDAFFGALKKLDIPPYEFLNYHEHAISSGSDSQAVAYIQLRRPDGRSIFGVGVGHNINYASIQGVLCAINRGESGE